MRWPVMLVIGGCATHGTTPESVTTSVSFSYVPPGPIEITILASGWSCTGAAILPDNTNDVGNWAPTHGATIDGRVAAGAFTTGLTVACQQ